MLSLRSTLLPVLVLFVFTAGFATVATADSITLNNCDSQGCKGSKLFLEAIDNGGSFSITLKLDADSYYGSRSGLNQVGFLAVKDWTLVSLDYASAGTWGTPVEGNTSANNLCQNGSTTDKVCLPGYVDITGGGKFTWKFTLTGGTLLPTEDWHIGGQYANGPGATSGQIISATSPIPEPTAALVFGVGMLVCSQAARRKR